MVSMETASYSILSDPECTPDILRRLAHLWSFLPYVCRGWIYLQRQAYLMRDLLKPQELSVIVCASQKIRPSTEFMGFMKPKIYEHLPTINLTSFLLILEALSYSQTTMYEPVLAHAVFDRAFHLVSKTSRFDAAVLELVARVSDIRRSVVLLLMLIAVLFPITSVRSYIHSSPIHSSSSLRRPCVNLPFPPSLPPIMQRSPGCGMPCGAVPHERV